MPHVTWYGYNMDALKRISVDPAICRGQACIKGTRIPVSVVLDCIAAGVPDEEIIENYPTLTVDGIRAAALYGASPYDRGGERT